MILFNCLIILCSVRVKSARWEGTLSRHSRLSESAGLGLSTVVEPVAHLSTLSERVFAALTAIDGSLTASDTPSGAILPPPKQSLQPHEWLRRDFNLRYAGPLDQMPTCSHSGERFDESSLQDKLAHARNATLSGSPMSSSMMNWSDVTCAICLEVVLRKDSPEFFTLGCGHCLCLRCVLHYLLLAAKSLPSRPVLQCPVCQVNLFLQFNTISHFNQYTQELH